MLRSQVDHKLNQDNKYLSRRGVGIWIVIKEDKRVS